jgi:hypothetical protein
MPDILPMAQWSPEVFAAYEAALAFERALSTLPPADPLAHIADGLMFAVRARWRAMAVAQAAP